MNNGCVRRRSLMLFPNQQMRQRLFRGIAILFVLYTAFDLANPQICNDGSSFIPESHITQLSRNDTTSAPITSVQSVKSSKNTEVPDQPTPDEDCFCCCAHVMPMSIFDSNLLAQIRPEFLTPTHVGIPTPRPKTYFHPPRFA